MWSFEIGNGAIRIKLVVAFVISIVCGFRDKHILVGSEIAGRTVGRLQWRRLEPLCWYLSARLSLQREWPCSTNFGGKRSQHGRSVRKYPDMSMCFGLYVLGSRHMQYPL